MFLFLTAAIAPVRSGAALSRAKRTFGRPEQEPQLPYPDEKMRELKKAFAKYGRQRQLEAQQHWNQARVKTYELHALKREAWQKHLQEKPWRGEAENSEYHEHLFPPHDGVFRRDDTYQKLHDKSSEVERHVGASVDCSSRALAFVALSDPRCIVKPGGRVRSSPQQPSGSGEEQGPESLQKLQHDYHAKTATQRLAELKQTYDQGVAPHFRGIHHERVALAKHEVREMKLQKAFGGTREEREARQLAIEDARRKASESRISRQVHQESMARNLEQAHTLAKSAAEHQRVAMQQAPDRERPYDPYDMNHIQENRDKARQFVAPVLRESVFHEQEGGAKVRVAPESFWHREFEPGWPGP